MTTYIAVSECRAIEMQSCLFALVAPGNIRDFSCICYAVNYAGCEHPRSVFPRLSRPVNLHRVREKRSARLVRRVKRREDILQPCSQYARWESTNCRENNLAMIQKEIMFLARYLWIPKLTVEEKRREPHNGPKQTGLKRFSGM